MIEHACNTFKVGMPYRVILPPAQDNHGRVPHPMPCYTDNEEIDAPTNKDGWASMLSLLARLYVDLEHPELTIHDDIWCDTWSILRLLRECMWEEAA